MKKGKILIIFGFIFLIIILIALVLLVYFYNFYVFEEMRICIGNPHELPIPCNSNQDCLDYLNVDELKNEMKDVPDFMKEKIDEVINKISYCENNCFIRETRGIDLSNQNFESQEFNFPDSCFPEEEEILLEIKGKEAIEIYKFYNSQN